MQSTLSKLRRDPIGLIKRGIYKKTVGRWKYGRGSGYDAGRYWGDRFQSYRGSMKSVGDEGLTEAENREMYERCGRVFREVVAAEVPDISTARVLEIGSGIGFYTDILRELGAADVTCADITDAYFDDLRARHPEYTFVQRDVTADALGGPYDVVMLIDVVQHIVEEERLDAALQNIAAALAPGGVFLVAPLFDRSSQPTFCYRQWQQSELSERMPDHVFGAPRTWRESTIVAVRQEPAVVGPTGA